MQKGKPCKNYFCLIEITHRCEVSGLNLLPGSLDNSQTNTRYLCYRGNKKMLFQQEDNVKVDFSIKSLHWNKSEIQKKKMKHCVLLIYIRGHQELVF